VTLTILAILLILQPHAHLPASQRGGIATYSLIFPISNLNSCTSASSFANCLALGLRLDPLALEQYSQASLVHHDQSQQLAGRLPESQVALDDQAAQM